MSFPRDVTLDMIAARIQAQIVECYRNSNRSFLSNCQLDHYETRNYFIGHILRWLGLNLRMFGVIRFFIVIAEWEHGGFGCPLSIGCYADKSLWRDGQHTRDVLFNNHRFLRTLDD